MFGNFGKDPYLDGLLIRLGTRILERSSDPKYNCKQDREAVDLIKEIKEYKKDGRNI